MKILVTGATGLVGTRLCTELILKGYDLIVLSRDKDKAQDHLNLPAQYYSWSPTSELPPRKAIEDCDAIINLMGESLANKRWSKSQKEKIYNSRIIGTKNLVQAVNQYREDNLDVFVSASAIGIYKPNTKNVVAENGEQDKSFLGSICQEWESAAKEVIKTNRLVNPRIGVVIASDGGMMSKVLPLFRLGLGGPIGFGEQDMSWIHVDDLVSLLIEALQNKKFEGAINAVSKQIISNKEFTKALSRAVNIPNIFPAPTLALKLAFGEMSSLMLDSIAVKPQFLIENNFKFKYENIDEALKDVCDGQIRESQFLSKNNAEVVSFFKDAKNLSKITPKELSFEVINHKDSPITDGSKLTYRFKKYGIPFTWTSLIKNSKENGTFTDVQISGPYKKWVHEHSFYQLKNGTLIVDQVHYQMPFGILGKALMPLVHKDIKNIFKFRKKALHDIFE